MSSRLLNLLRKVPQIPNQRYLQFKPTEGREKVAIKEPQKIEAYYEYIYKRDFYPETYGNANEQHVGGPYTNALLYEWDNYQFKYEGEWYDAGPLSLYVVACLSPFMMMFFFYQLEAYHISVNGNYITAGNLNGDNLFMKRLMI